MSDKFEKITRVRLPYDRRHENPSKNYGIHGFDIIYILKGPKGAVQFGFSVNTYLPHVEREYIHRGLGDNKKITGFGVDYHSKKPMYKGQKSTKCDLFRKGGKCYCDGSGLLADEWVNEIFSIRGERLEDKLWEKLEQEYNEIFNEERINNESLNALDIFVWGCR